MITETHPQTNPLTDMQSSANDFATSLENMASQNVRSAQAIPQTPPPAYISRAATFSSSSPPPSYSSIAPRLQSFDISSQVSASTRRAHNISSSSSLSHKIVAGLTLTSVLAAVITMAVVLSGRENEKR